MATPQKIQCFVDRIHSYGRGVYDLELRPERPVPRFKPGQFLHLALDDYDPSGYWPESRVFSIASRPEERDRIQILYSVKGLFTSRMERELIPGRKVWIKLPYGDFQVEADRDVVLIAGGTGISAFLAFLASLPTPASRRIFLAYGARGKSLLTNREFIDAQSDAGQFKTIYFIEDESYADGAVQEQGGKISLETLWKHLEDPYNFLYYLSGPPVMLKALSDGLVSLGIPTENVKIDAWE